MSITQARAALRPGAHIWSLSFPLAPDSRLSKLNKTELEHRVCWSAARSEQSQCRMHVSGVCNVSLSDGLPSKIEKATAFKKKKKP